jgi:flagellum-specific peptidoglycan hydrolase FlgJ
LSGISQRGVGAWERARLDRVHALAETDPAAALDGVELVLGDLHRRRSAEADPLDTETRTALAQESMALRTRLASEGGPRLKGFRRDFIARVAPGAAWSDWEAGVPASITIAQAILESSWGRSAPGNNLFGLKGVGPDGSTRRKVVEYNGHRRRVRGADFRAYTSVDEALADHSAILAQSPRYARARAVQEDPARYARALQGTYATDPRYARKLVEMIETYRLDRFDWNPRSPWR